MIVVDTSVLIAILRNESGWQRLLRALHDGKSALVGAPTVFEFLMVAEGDRAAENVMPPRAVLDLPMIGIVPWTPPMAEIAQTAFLKYGKGRHPAKLNFGDCMSYALAKSLDCPLLYKGEDFARTDIRSAIAATQ